MRWGPQRGYPLACLPLPQSSSSEEENPKLTPTSHPVLVRRAYEQPIQSAQRLSVYLTSTSDTSLVLAILTLSLSLVVWCSGRESKTGESARETVERPPCSLVDRRRTYTHHS